MQHKDFPVIPVSLLVLAPSRPATRTILHYFGHSLPLLRTRLYHVYHTSLFAAATRLYYGFDHFRNVIAVPNVADGRVNNKHRHKTYRKRGKSEEEK